MNIRNFLSNLSFVVLSLNFARMFRISAPIVVVNEKRDRSIEQNQLIVDSLYSRVNNSDTLLNLSSKVLYDEILLTAWNSNGFIINSGGNIDVRDQITVNQFETVVLKRISDKWVIISKTL